MACFGGDVGSHKKGCLIKESGMRGEHVMPSICFSLGLQNIKVEWLYQYGPVGVGPRLALVLRSLTCCGGVFV